MKRNVRWFWLIGCVLAVLTFSGAGAQDGEELKLRLSRDFGYSSGAGSIQGLFTLKATGAQDLQVVDFYLDGKLLLQDVQAPFEYKFNTDVYPLGNHTLSATGITVDGRELHARDIKVRFVTAQEGWQAAMRILFPLLGLIFGAILLSAAIPLLMGKGKLAQLPPGARRNYGFFGGTICPKCFRPFALHIYKMNLLFAALDRCPYCGKWSLVRVASPEALRAAEAAEVSDAGATVPEESEEEKLRKEIDASRYRSL